MEFQRSRCLNWLWKIPDEIITEYCIAVKDGTHDSPKKTENGYKLLTSKHIGGEKLLIDQAYCISKEDYIAINNRSKVDMWDILMGMIGTVGELYLVDSEPNFAIKNMALIKCGTEHKAKWIYYYLKSTQGQQQIQEKMSGSSQRFISLGDMRNLMISNPKEEVQRKIVNILTTYDNLIKNNNRRIAILEEMAQKLYREWFVHFRFPGHENVKMVESEIGLIPEGWTVQSPKEVAAHYIGGGWGKESCSDALQPAFVIRGTDIPNARQNDIENCPLRYHTKSNLKDRCLSNGDIVIEVSGGSKGQPVGRPLLITSELLESFNGQQVICASFCKLYRCNSTLINPYYVYLWLLEIYKNGEIEKYQSQSTGIINFKFEYFLDSPIILVPQIDVQNAFNKQVEMIFKQINNLGKKNTNLRRTRDLLLPRLISGDIDVSELDIPIKEG